MIRVFSKKFFYPYLVSRKLHRAKISLPQSETHEKDSMAKSKTVEKRKLFTRKNSESGQVRKKSKFDRNLFFSLNIKTNSITEVRNFEKRQKSNQITLVEDNIEEAVIDQIDSELHLTIGQIRSHLMRTLDATEIRLLFRNRLLDDNDKTLADYDWTSGFCGSITVQIMRDNTVQNVIYERPIFIV